MEMVMCRNLKLPEPGEDETEQKRQKHESDDEMIDREDEGAHEDEAVSEDGGKQANVY